MTGILNKTIPSTFFAIVLGAGKFVNDYTGGARKSPNAEWALDITLGANRGAL